MDFGGVNRGNLNFGGRAHVRIRLFNSLKHDNIPLGPDFEPISTRNFRVKKPTWTPKIETRPLRGFFQRLGTILSGFQREFSTAKGTFRSQHLNLLDIFISFLKIRTSIMCFSVFSPFNLLKILVIFTQSDVLIN